jgi:hypothetical protein
MNNNIAIVPKDVVKTFTITGFFIDNVNVKLFEQVSLNVCFKDINNNVVKVENVVIAGQDYQNWSQDDNYIINYITNKFNLVLQN